ncbi:hypothetical protein T439DRAFT_356965 [Meredithblackwellia eburnea MCA 4105]
MTVDPGRALQWLKNPSYVTSLVQLLANDFQAGDVNRAQLPFQDTATLSKQEKEEKEQYLSSLTGRMFHSPREQDYRASWERSVAKRIQTIGKEYKESIVQINAFDTHSGRDAYINDFIKPVYPWWDNLHLVLSTHPDFDRLLPLEGDGEGGAVAGPGPAAHAHAQAQSQAQNVPQQNQHQRQIIVISSDEDEPERMQGIESTDAHDRDKEEETEQKECLKCERLFPVSQITLHQRLCFDGQLDNDRREASGVFTPECFVCGRDLQNLSSTDRDHHIDQCCSKPTLAEEFDVFECTETNQPKTDEGELAECGMCLEEFETGGPSRQMDQRGNFVLFIHPIDRNIEAMFKFLPSPLL